MIEAMSNQHFETIERPPVQMAAGPANFAELFGDAAKGAPQTVAAAPAGSAGSASSPFSTVPATQSSLGDPDVQAWLNSYYAERTAANPQDGGAANIPYQAAAGAASNYSAGSVYGPDQVYTQALYNQNGYLFATLTGNNPANLTSQLPGIPSQQAQQAFDQSLAVENAQRLASGQPIDTAAYWSDPGPMTVDGHTYTSQELGYAGPAQSSGAEPIYISQGDLVPGTNTFSVPGYSGTVTGIKPDCYYTLQQLEQAGLKSGQPDAQFHPGSWSSATSS
ncbi:MAG: hypothetical protein ABSF64_01485 [Bryobacteraceae bacterium]